MSQMFVLSIYVLMAQAKVEAESRFNGGGTSALSNEPQQQQLQVNLNAWQPLTGHNNWLILQATASTSMQQEKQQQHQRHPVNYYAYNHRFQTKEHAAAAADNGNYKQVRTNPNDSPSPSYVLAISQLPPSDVGQDVRDRPETRKAGNFVGLTNDNDEPVDDLDNNSMASLDIMNYFEPFQHAMHKVRSFCDTVREIISMGTAENEEEEMQQLSDAESNRWEENTSLATTTTTSKEVQGRLSRLPAISQSRRVKKLKRRLQKLFLPLLIAYKLKFLTLIPVLIGGLTLLVGTTGLAGFFFALFTAVMSLKSSTGGGVGHSSKATLFKKI